MEWISVKKKKPKLNQLVIVCFCGVASYGWRNDKDTWIIADEPHYANSKLDRISFVTDWMPLPKPPATRLQNENTNSREVK